MLFVTGAVQILCKKITRQLFLRTDLPDLAKYGGAGASGRGLYSELHKDRSDRWFTWKLRISNGLWLHSKGHDEKNHYFFSEKEETGKVTQKKILLKSMRALEFQCPLKFRCQTRDFITNGVLCKAFQAADCSAWRRMAPSALSAADASARNCRLAPTHQPPCTLRVILRSSGRNSPPTELPSVITST